MGKKGSTTGASPPAKKAKVLADEAVTEKSPKKLKTEDTANEAVAEKSPKKLKKEDTADEAVTGKGPKKLKKEDTGSKTKKSKTDKKEKKDKKKGKKQEPRRFDGKDGPFTFKKFLKFYGNEEKALERWEAGRPEKEGEMASAKVPATMNEEKASDSDADEKGGDSDAGEGVGQEDVHVGTGGTLGVEEQESSPQEVQTTSPVATVAHGGPSTPPGTASAPDTPPGAANAPGTPPGALSAPDTASGTSPAAPNDDWDPFDAAFELPVDGEKIAPSDAKEDATSNIPLATVDEKSRDTHAAEGVGQEDVHGGTGGTLGVEEQERSPQEVQTTSPVATVAPGGPSTPPGTASAPDTPPGAANAPGTPPGALSAPDTARGTLPHKNASDVDMTPPDSSEAAAAAVAESPAVRRLQSRGAPSDAVDALRKLLGEMPPASLPAPEADTCIIQVPSAARQEVETMLSDCGVPACFVREASKDSGLSVGKEVEAKFGNSFFKATLVEYQKGTLKVKYEYDGSEAELPSTEVKLKNSDSVLAPGEQVEAKFGNSFFDATVTEYEKEILKVKYEYDGSEAELPSTEVKSKSTMESLLLCGLERPRASAALLICMAIEQEIQGYCKEHVTRDHGPSSDGPADVDLGVVVHELSGDTVGRVKSKHSLLERASGARFQLLDAALLVAGVREERLRCCALIDVFCSQYQGVIETVPEEVSDSCQYVPAPRNRLKALIGRKRETMNGIEQKNGVVVFTLEKAGESVDLVVISCDAESRQNAVKDIEEVRDDTASQWKDWNQGNDDNNWKRESKSWENDWQSSGNSGGDKWQDKDHRKWNDTDRQNKDKSWKDEKWEDKDRQTWGNSWNENSNKDDWSTEGKKWNDTDRQNKDRSWKDEKWQGKDQQSWGNSDTDRQNRDKSWKDEKWEGKDRQSWGNSWDEKSNRRRGGGGGRSGNKHWGNNSWDSKDDTWDSKSDSKDKSWEKEEDKSWEKEGDTSWEKEDKSWEKKEDDNNDKDWQQSAGSSEQQAQTPHTDEQLNEVRQLLAEMDPASYPQSVEDWAARQDQIFRGWQPLTSPWIRIWSRSRQEPYFFNLATQESSFS